MIGRRGFARVRRVVGYGLVALAAVLVGERALDLVAPFPLDTIQRYGESRRVLARDGTLLRVEPTPRGERLIRVSLDEVSVHVEDALVAAEDERFFEHSGVDYAAAARALISNLRRGRIVSGASTLTMQVARLAQPHPRTLGHKLLEMWRARQIERRLDKTRILEAYLDMAPFGGTLRGIEAAARYWYGKPAKRLDAQEAATLVAMLPAPTRRAPNKRPALLRYHRDRVLHRMLVNGYLDPAEYRKCVGSPITARRHDWPWRVPHFCDFITRRTSRTEVRTGLEIGLQERIQDLVDACDRDADGVAVVVLDRASGGIQAMIGAYDWHESQWNAASSRRAAGSTLKPFLYALALELGVTGPDLAVSDARGRFGSYSPQNFDSTFLGRMRASEALVRSRNLPAVRLLRRVGTERFRDLLQRARLPVGERALHLDAALGTLAVAPFELAEAYRLLASKGGLGLSSRARREVLSALAEQPPSPALRPGVVAWKTGTSSGRCDAWSVGVTEDHVVVVWLGNLSGRGAPDLVGGRRATELMARVVALFGSA